MVILKDGPAVEDSLKCTLKCGNGGIVVVVLLASVGNSADVVQDIWLL